MERPAKRKADEMTMTTMKLGTIKKSKYGGYVANFTISKGRVRLVRGETKDAVVAEADALRAELTAPVSAERQAAIDGARMAGMIRDTERAAYLRTDAGRREVAQDIDDARHAGITAEQERLDYVGGQW